MSEYKIGFIGAGNMGGALITAACRSIDPDQVLIADPDGSKCRELAEKTGCHTAADNLDVVKKAEYIVLAVKPGIIRSVASGICDVLNREAGQGHRHAVVTIAAGVAIAAIRECIGGQTPIIRIMPNPPVAVGQGMILLTGDGEEDPYVRELQVLLKAAGDFLYIPESSFDITTGISSCTPAYAYMFISALADGAVQVGVPRERAIRLAAKTLLGSAQMVLDTGLHPDQLKDNVCSPGGSTIAGVHALEERGFRHAAAEAIIQATKKNLELGK